MTAPDSADRDQGSEEPANTPSTPKAPVFPYSMTSTPPREHSQLPKEVISSTISNSDIEEVRGGAQFDGHVVFARFLREVDDIKSTFKNAKSTFEKKMAAVESELAGMRQENDELKRLVRGSTVKAGEKKLFNARLEALELHDKIARKQGPNAIGNGGELVSKSNGRLKFLENQVKDLKKQLASAQMSHSQDGNTQQPSIRKQAHLEQNLANRLDNINGRLNRFDASLKKSNRRLNVFESRKHGKRTRQEASEGSGAEDETDVPRIKKPRTTPRAPITGLRTNLAENLEPGGKASQDIGPRVLEARPGPSFLRITTGAHGLSGGSFSTSSAAVENHISAAEAHARLFGASAQPSEASATPGSGQARADKNSLDKERD